MRQPADDRALYYRQLRATVSEVFLPQLSTPAAIDAAALVDRILAEFIVEEEAGPQLSASFGAEFALLLGEPVEVGADVSPERFDELRRRAADVVALTVGSGQADERARAVQLVDVERRFLERVDDLRRDVLADKKDEGAGDSHAALRSSVTPDDLAAYLRGRCPGSPGLTVTRMQVVPGGRSKETLLVRLEGTNELPPDLIVRKDRPIGLLPTNAADEFAVLDIVYRHGGIPVPQPFFAEREADELLGEGTVLVMARVDGTKAGEYFPDLAAPPAEHGHALGEQLATALARLHAVSLDDVAAAGLGSGEVVTAQSLTAAVEGMAARIADLSGPPIVAVPAARQWLVDHVDDVTPSGRLSLLQGDVGLHNMLVVGDRLTALVDWEAATIGPPARELAAVWPAATALMAWDDFVDVYRGAGGPSEAVDPRAVTFYRVFFALGACMTSRAGGHLFRTGAKRDLLTAHSGLDAHFRTQRNLARTLKDAEDGASGGFL
jgi:aminoglycoside phosphotransferase (APT) family kinase protein